MSETAAPASLPQAVAQIRVGGEVVVTLSGDWQLHGPVVDFAPVEAVLRSFAQAPDEVNPGWQQSVVSFNTAELGKWDSTLMAFLAKVSRIARLQGMKINYDSLPEGASRLLLLANCAPERETPATRGFHPLFTRVGTLTLWIYAQALGMFEFMGECTMALWRFVRGKARYRRSDFWLLVQQAGLESLPIVALIAFLVGMIMAFVGAVQLQKFGADIFVADLVGLAMVREMGAMMTGIILCGRIGASYAAQIGSMKTAEEVDALETFGISPIDFLVLPRLLAVTLMTPVLVMFADVIGIIGGMLVGVSMLDVTMSQFINRLISALTMTQISTGLIKSVFFGMLIAYTGCLRGMQCGSSSEEVGRVTTSAVVTGITMLIVADAVFAVLFTMMGI